MNKVNTDNVDLKEKMYTKGLEYHQRKSGEIASEWMANRIDDVIMNWLTGDRWTEEEQFNGR